jgi:hypothetical protein
VIGGLFRIMLLAAGAAAVVGYLAARREAARRNVPLRAVLPEAPALLRRELDGVLADARAAARDGSRSAAERRRELHGDLAEARLGGRGR